MSLEIGRRYRLVRYDGLPHQDGVLEAGRLGLKFRPDNEHATYAVSDRGDCDDIGRLVNVEALKRPILGDDPAAFDDFKRVFAGWDFSTGTY